MVMKKDIHSDNYRLVVFKDLSNGEMFLTRSTAKTDDKVKYTDGNEYPVVNVHISSTSHPFFTGQKVLVDTAIKVRSRFSSIRRPTQSATLSRTCYAHNRCPAAWPPAMLLRASKAPCQLRH